MASERNSLITYITLSYKRAVLEDKARNEGRSLNDLEYTMEIKSVDSACSNEASRAFIELGGMRQFSYEFQDEGKIFRYYSGQVLNLVYLVRTALLTLTPTVILRTTVHHIVRLIFQE